MNSVALLSYDIINTIFDYLAQLEGNTFRFVIDYRGKLAFRVNPWFTGIREINKVNLYKLSFKARIVRLRLHSADDFFQYGEVEALEEPRRVFHEDVEKTNRALGIINESRCYTYIDPIVNQLRYAYIDCRRYTSIHENLFFHHGQVIADDGTPYGIVSYSYDWSDPNAIIHMIVQPTNLWWIAEQEPEYEDADEEIEEVDFENLPPLQMYM